MASIGRSGGRAYVYGTEDSGKVGRSTAYVIASAEIQNVVVGTGTSTATSTALGALGNVRQVGVAAGIATVAGYTNFGIAVAHGTSTALAVGYSAYAAMANATESVELHRRLGSPLTSTADAKSFAQPPSVYLVSTANATSVTVDFSHGHTESITLVSSAVGTESVELHYPCTVTPSVANATAASPWLPRLLILSSTAEATSSTLVVFTNVAKYVSTAHAVSSVVERESTSLSSTAAATEAVLGVRAVRLTLVSTGAVSALVAASNLTRLILKSTALASSVVSGKLSSYQILLSSADATSYIILPDTTLQAFWVNPATTAVGTWGGMPFESMVEREGEMYAAGEDGIYWLETEASDGGVRIDAELRWDLLRFNTPMRHRPGVVLLAGFSAGPLNVRVVNEQGRFDYPTHLDKNTKDSNLRAKLGKGLTSRYIRLAVTNPNGVAFSITDAQIEIIELSRRIGGKHG